MRLTLIGLALAATATGASAQGITAASGSTWRQFMTLDVPQDGQGGRSGEKHSQAGFTIGPAAGFLRTRDADDGTWFGGAQARLHLGPVLAAEAAVTFHQDSFADGDIKVTQYPVQVSGLIYPFLGWPAKPYIVAGGGWYYTRVDFSGVFTALDSDTTHVFGAHVGVGIDLQLGPTATLNADFRWVFVDPNFDNSNDEEFDFMQFGLGLNIGI